MNDLGYRRAVVACDETAHLVTWADESDIQRYKIQGLAWESRVFKNPEDAWENAFEVMSKIIGDLETAYKIPLTGKERGND